MRAMRAEQFSGYEACKLVDLPKPAATVGKVLVRITAAGVTPLDHTILFGNFHIPEVPLVLGNEGAGVVEAGVRSQREDTEREEEHCKNRNPKSALTILLAEAAGGPAPHPEAAGLQRERCL